MWQVGVQGCPSCAWHGSMPGNHAQVGLIRLFCGRSRAARTTFSLNAWSYVVRFFLVREPGGDEVGVRIGTFLYWDVTWGCFVFFTRRSVQTKNTLGRLMFTSASQPERACHRGSETRTQVTLFQPPSKVVALVSAHAALGGQNGDDGQGEAAGVQPGGAQTT